MQDSTLIGSRCSCCRSIWMTSTQLLRVHEILFYEFALSQVLKLATVIFLCVLMTVSMRNSGQKYHFRNTEKDTSTPSALSECNTALSARIVLFVHTCLKTRTRVCWWRTCVFFVFCFPATLQIQRADLSFWKSFQHKSRSIWHVLSKIFKRAKCTRRAQTIQTNTMQSWRNTTTETSTMSFWWRFHSRLQLMVWKRLNLNEVSPTKSNWLRKHFFWKNCFVCPQVKQGDSNKLSRQLYFDEPWLEVLSVSPFSFSPCSTHVW